MSNFQAGGPHLVGCLQLLIQYIHGYPPYQRQFLHLQFEDAPCHGDGDPLIMANWYKMCNYLHGLSISSSSSKFHSGSSKCQQTVCLPSCAFLLGVHGYTEFSIPCMALQPLPGLGLPQKVPPFFPVFSSSSPSSYSSYS